MISPRSPRRFLRLCMLSAVLASEASAGSNPFKQHLAAAIARYESLDYEQALEELSQARRYARRADDVASVLLYRGVVLGDLGKQAEAVAAFAAALKVKPGKQLPLKVSPKVRALFAQGRAQADQRRAVRTRAPPPLEPPKPSPSSPVAASTPPLAPPEPPTLAPSQEPIQVPPAWTPSAPPTVVTRRSGGVKPLTWGLGSAAVAAGGVGVFFAVRAQQDWDSARTATFQDDAAQHLHAARGEALAANILFAGAAALAAGTVVNQLVRMPWEPPPPPR